MVSSAPAIKQCGNCGHTEDSTARFCSSCGLSSWTTLAVGPSYFYQSTAALGGLNTGSDNGTPTLVLPENMPSTVPASMARALTHMSDLNVPGFAHVRKSSPEALRQKQVELAKLMVILVRERVFLLFHFTVWASVNVLGFCLALKCYNEFIGDEVTKIMIGCTPFWVFNILGLTCLVPIRNTRRYISRLKDEIAHLKFSIEYAGI